MRNLHLREVFFFFAKQCLDPKLFNFYLMFSITLLHIVVHKMLMIIKFVNIAVVRACECGGL